jgi:hypothetical protein
MNNITEYTKEELLTIHKYLTCVMSKCQNCQNCEFLHDNCSCFFAFECIQSDFVYFKERT